MSFLKSIIGLWRERGVPSGSQVLLREGSTLLAIVKKDTLLAHTFDIALSHADFVKRTFGKLPEGAWVGTIRKAGQGVVAINSKTFYDNQQPAPQPVQDVVRQAFR